MTTGTSIELSVLGWSAWAPGLVDRISWEEWANGNQTIEGSARADVSSVGSLQRRRLSDVTRMAFATVEQCMSDDLGTEPREGRMRFLFCSRYGEFPRSFNILQGLVRKEPVSPTAFSMSVHNTAASQFSIHCKDPSPFTAIAAGESSLENAFVDAWAQLQEDDCDTIMLVYHDQPLPDLYQDQATSVTCSLALAILLTAQSAGDIASILRLSWLPSRTAEGTTATRVNTTLPVIRLLLGTDTTVTLDTGRLAWTWTGSDAQH